jgi:hypothetical protein
MALPEALRAKAMQIFEEFLDQLPEEAVRELISGDQTLARLQVDRRLSQARTKGIEETYAFLNGLKSQPDVKNLLALTAPSTRGKPAWINYTLETLFGRAYAPSPETTTSDGQGAARTKKIPWNPSEAEQLLANSTSVIEGEGYLTNTTATKANLAEFALALNITVKKSSTKSEMIKSIVNGTIQARGSFQRALTG